MFRQTRWGVRAIIGDSIITTMDAYDMRSYGIGKGPSATTVSVQDDVIALSGSVLLKGMVTDVSAGTKDDFIISRFPNGVSAVSDASMSDWMLYVYKGFAVPSNATGVEVIVEVFDPNSNYYEVGRTTSDASGFYSLPFTPEVPGEYTVVARFAGTKSYWPSYGETAINVGEAATATPVPTNPPASLADQYLLPGIGIIVAAIAVVGAVIVLMLRKR
jgi:hypothetical protein